MPGIKENALVKAEITAGDFVSPSQRCFRYCLHTITVSVSIITLHSVLWLQFKLVPCVLLPELFSFNCALSLLCLYISLRLYLEKNAWQKFLFYLTVVVRTEIISFPKYVLEMFVCQTVGSVCQLLTRFANFSHSCDKLHSCLITRM